MIPEPVRAISFGIHSIILGSPAQKIKQTDFVFNL